MSWSITAVGRPEAVEAAIDKQAAAYTSGPSKLEIDEVVPHLKALVALARGNSAVRLTAAGHANWDIGREGASATTRLPGGNISVSIETLHGFVE